MSNKITSQDLKDHSSETLDWTLIQKDMKSQLGSDIYESWLRKIEFVEEMSNYILLSVSSRFIRDWITSRYLDQILQIVKNYKKEIIRIEFKISDQDIKKDEALKFLPKLNSELMKVAKPGIIKKANASRNISRITKKISAL